MLAWFARRRGGGTAPIALALVLGAISAVGCKPQIGDSCKLSTDCSVNGDRLCDTSQPEGYCTIFNCEPDTCPGEAMCVEFHGGPLRSPDTPPPRLARRFCLASCDSNPDCRPGYVCARVAGPTEAIANERDARIIDTVPSRLSVCLP